MRIDRGRRDDHLEVGSFGERLFENADEKVYIEGALVRFVHDDRVIGAEISVLLRFSEQNAVRHEFYSGRAGGAVLETYFVSDEAGSVLSDFFGYACGKGDRRDPARLGASDEAGSASSRLQAELGNLRALARSCLTGNYEDLVFADRADDLFPPFGDRQLGGVGRHK